MAKATVEVADFGETPFGQVELGDRRRTKRLVKLANRTAAHPEGSLPRKLGDPASYQAMSRLFKNDAVTPAAVLKPHRQATLEKMRACRETVLVIHDTTELDDTSHASLREALGQIGDGRGRGFECHNSLAGRARTGELRGLANQILHHRADVPQHESYEARRERADRGADTLEFLDDEHRRGRNYVIRSSHHRPVCLGHAPGPDGEGEMLLHDQLRSAEPVGGRWIHVPAEAGRPARVAKCLVTIVAVRLKPPTPKRGKPGDEPLCVGAVRVGEINAPADVKEPLEWRLLTSIPTESLEDALRIVGDYEPRWTIEDYHKGRKTGCGIEGRPFQHVARWEPMIALLSVVAVMLVNLRQSARTEEAHEKLATTCVPEAYVAVRSVWRDRERRVNLTVPEFFMALARLGGHQNRKSDGPPGWITLWRGWNQLPQMLDYALKAGVEKM